MKDLSLRVALRVLAAANPPNCGDMVQPRDRQKRRWRNRLYKADYL